MTKTPSNRIMIDHVNVQIKQHLLC